MSFCRHRVPPPVPPQRQIPAHAGRKREAERDRRAELQRRRHAARQSRRQIPSCPSRRWQSRPRSPDRRCADAGSASCEVNTTGNSAMVPLIAGPTQRDSVTTVATNVATSAARNGMSYQRRVISGIFTWRSAASAASRSQTRRRSREGRRRATSAPRAVTASAIHTTIAADALTSSAATLRQQHIGQAEENRDGVDRQARQRALGDERRVVIEREKRRKKGRPKSAVSRSARRSRDRRVR